MVENEIVEQDRWNDARMQQIEKLRKELGWTFAEIGKEFGVSRQRIQQVYRRWKLETAYLKSRIPF